MADGNATTTMADGNVTTTMADGNVTTTMADGNATTTMADGNTTTTVADGNTSTTTVAANTTTIAQPRRLAAYCECDAAMCKTYQCPLGMKLDTTRMNATQGEYGRDCCEVDDSASYVEVTGMFEFNNVDATDAQVDEAVRQALAAATSTMPRNVWTNITSVASEGRRLAPQDWSVEFTVRAEDLDAAETVEQSLQGLTESQVASLLSEQFSNEGVTTGDLELTLGALDVGTNTTTAQATGDNSTTTSNTSDVSGAAVLTVRAVAASLAVALVQVCVVV
jgi:hypothetical protein